MKVSGSQQAFRKGTVAFSVIEVLIALSVSTIFFTTAALVFQNVTANSKRLGTLVTVELGATALNNFYGLSSTTAIQVYSAPNYGRAAFADELREFFREDLYASTAVYCLGRADGNWNSIRSLDIAAPADGELMDTPEKFRTHLLSLFPVEGAVFVPYTGASTAQNATIFLVGQSSDPTKIRINAVYEIDIVPYPTATPEGNYASVRRYVNASLTNYYDVIFDLGNGSSFSPIFVHFPKRTRSFSTASDFNQAYEHPFYLIWWPDPAAHALELSNSPAGLSSPYSTYFQMGGRTSFSFVAPMYPAQL